MTNSFGTKLIIQYVSSFKVRTGCDSGSDGLARQAMRAQTWLKMNEISQAHTV